MPWLSRRNIEVKSASFKIEISLESELLEEEAITILDFKVEILLQNWSIT